MRESVQIELKVFQSSTFYFMILDSSSSLAARAVAKVNRQSNWELTQRVPLNFPTYHPQGLALIGELTFLSSAQILEAPITPDLGRRTTGRGTGHLFVIDSYGNLLRDIILGEKDMYHPGGIDFDGESIWVSVAEYRSDSTTIILTIDPLTFQVRERFRVSDHIGWVVSDADNGLIFGGSWGSRFFYTWNTEGRELDRWPNPSSFIDYQDGQFVGDGLVICSGISILPLSEGDGEYELGGVAIVDFNTHQVVHESPINLFSPAGHVVTRNPFSLTTDGGHLRIHVAPDDGSDICGTEILIYTIA